MVSYDRKSGFQSVGITVSTTLDSGCNPSRYIQLFATHRVILIEHVIDPMDDGFSLDDIYHALDIIAEHQDAIDEFCMRQIPLNGCVREAGCCLYLRHTLSFLLQLQNRLLPSTLYL